MHGCLSSRVCLPVGEPGRVPRAARSLDVAHPSISFFGSAAGGPTRERRRVAAGNYGRGRGRAAVTPDPGAEAQALDRRC
jgi:hypothetical protein